MTLDLLDSAFLSRWNTVPPAASELASGVAKDACPSAADRAGKNRGAPAESMPPPPVATGDQDGVGPRLLTVAWRQWQDLASRVEAARHRGRRVIAIAGGERGEGRTQLVECLAVALESRGRDVVCVGPAEWSAFSSEPLGGGASHDKRIVLFDAGVWFPPGPIRRSRLAVASLGCDAAILVRRSGGHGGPAREAALESLGIEVLGEVLTFVTDSEPSGSGPADTSLHVLPGNAVAGESRRGDLP